MTPVTGAGVADPAFTAYFAAIAEGSSAKALRVARQLRADGAALVEVLDRLVCAAQAEVGRRWAANEWNVAQEHRATSVSEDVVAALAGELADPAEGARTVVVTCVDGEWHSLPARIVAAVLADAGWRVHFLGASVPVEHLEQFLQDVGPDAVAISCMVPTSLARARRMVEAARDAGVPVLAGGAGFGPDGRWARRIGANAAAGDASGALATLEGPDWPRYSSPPPSFDQPDNAASLLVRHRAAVASASHHHLADLWPGLTDYNDWQMARTDEDLGFLADFLATALYVDDVALYTGFVDWMQSILESRGVPAAALRAGLTATARAVADVLGDQPRALEFIGSATRRLSPPAATARR